MWYQCYYKNCACDLLILYTLIFFILIILYKLLLTDFFFQSRPPISPLIKSTSLTLDHVKVWKDQGFIFQTRAINKRWELLPYHWHINFHDYLICLNINVYTGTLLIFSPFGWKHTKQAKIKFIHQLSAI